MVSLDVSIEEKMNNEGSILPATNTSTHPLHDLAYFKMSRLGLLQIFKACQ